MFSKLISIFSKKPSPDLFSEKNWNYSEQLLLTSKDYGFELLDKTKQKFTLATIYTHVGKTTDSLLFQTSGIRQDVIVIPLGILGRELSKSPSLFAISEKKKAVPVFIEILQGSGVIITESVSRDKQVTLTHIKFGDKILVKPQFAFVLINSSNTDLVCSMFVDSSVIFKKGFLKEQYGSSIYVLEKGFIRNENTNPHYSLKELSGTHIEEYSFDATKSLYEQFTNLPEKFNFLKGDEEFH
jgi:hypothetical protein